MHARPVDVLYVPATQGFPRFEQRVSEVMRREQSRVNFHRVQPNDLAQFTPVPVYLSPSLPNVVFVRDGKVLGQTMGELSVNDLAAAVHGAERFPGREGRHAA